MSSSPINGKLKLAQCIPEQRFELSSSECQVFNADVAKIKIQPKNCLLFAKSEGEVFYGSTSIEFTGSNEIYREIERVHLLNKYFVDFRASQINN